MTRTALLLVPAFLLTPACGSDDPPPSDAGPADLGAAPSDAGVRARCPLPENQPSCVALDDESQGCLPPGEALSTNNRCGDFCPGYYATPCGSESCPVVCAVGQCRTESTLEPGELLNLNMPVGAVTDAAFFVQIVMYGVTSGGNAFTCADDVMGAPTTFFEDPCYNVTDVRAGTAAQLGDVFRFTFSRVPAATRMVFVVLGFESDDTTAAPLGISCTEVDVPAAGAGMGDDIEVAANEMLPLDGD